MMRPVLAIVAVFILLAACSKSKPVDIPRRKAYPRIEIPDSSFVTLDSVTPRLSINRAARAVVKRRDVSGIWVDISYPGLNAEIYVTLTPVTDATAAAVLDNRIERIALNIGDNPCEVVSLAANGFESEMYVVANGSTLPVQFLAVSPSEIASGTAQISVAANDSVRPVVDLLSRDILHLLKNLQR